MSTFLMVVDSKLNQFQSSVNKTSLLKGYSSIYVEAVDLMASKIHVPPSTQPRPAMMFYCFCLYIGLDLIECTQRCEIYSSGSQIVFPLRKRESFAFA